MFPCTELAVDLFMRLITRRIALGVSLINFRFLPINNMHLFWMILLFATAASYTCLPDKYQCCFEGLAYFLEASFGFLYPEYPQPYGL